MASVVENRPKENWFRRNWFKSEKQRKSLSKTAPTTPKRESGVWSTNTSGQSRSDATTKIKNTTGSPKTLRSQGDTSRGESSRGTSKTGASSVTDASKPPAKAAVPTETGQINTTKQDQVIISTTKKDDHADKKLPPKAPSPLPSALRTNRFATKAPSPIPVPGEIAVSDREISALQDDITFESGDVFGMPLEKMASMKRYGTLLTTASTVVSVIKPPLKLLAQAQESEAKSSGPPDSTDDIVEEPEEADHTPTMKWYACW